MSNNATYHQEPTTPMTECYGHQLGDYRYIEVGDGLPVEEGQLNNLGSLGNPMGLNLPVSLQECEVESSELDQYLPPQGTNGAFQHSSGFSNITTFWAER